MILLIFHRYVSSKLIEMCLEKSLEDQVVFLISTTSFIVTFVATFLFCVLDKGEGGLGFEAAIGSSFGILISFSAACAQFFIFKALSSEKGDAKRPSFRTFRGGLKATIVGVGLGASIYFGSPVAILFCAVFFLMVTIYRLIRLVILISLGWSILREIDESRHRR